MDRTSIFLSNCKPKEQGVSNFLIFINKITRKNKKEMLKERKKAIKPEAEKDNHNHNPSLCCTNMQLKKFKVHNSYA
jgi:hypothetical protein